MRIYWSDAEEEFIKYNYVDLGLSVSELYNNHIKIYPFRTLTSLKIKIKKLKLRHTKEQTSNIKSRLNSGENNGMYGRDAWCKGQTKYTNEKIKTASEKLSITRKQMHIDGKLPDFSGENNPMYGKDGWCKGQTKYTNDILKKAGEKNAISQKERWDSFSEEKQNSIIGRLTLASNKARKDTKIEIIIKDVLDKMELSYIKNHKHSRFVFDFYLTDYNFVIECQGDYWHGNSEFFKNLNQIQIANIERDKIKIEYLKSSNIKSFFIWENEIYKNQNNLEEIIWEQLKN